jgi:single-strand DNA-binding protein
MNRFEIIGNTTTTPNLITLDGGRKVANFTVAVDEPWRDRDGEWHERTQFHRVAVWGPRAERVAEVLGKGDLVLISGRMHYSTAEKDGTRYTNATLEVSSPRHTWKRLQKNGGAGAEQEGEADEAAE